MSSIERTLGALESLTTAASTLPPYARSQALVGIAQASATLALAEQQRLANLIALASWPQSDSDLCQIAADALDELAPFHRHSMGGYREVRAEHAAALGLPIPTTRESDR